MSAASSELTTTDAPRAIVTIDQSTVRADSRQVAVTFGKRHADVLRAIDALVSNEVRLRERNFAFMQGQTILPTGGVREDRYCLMDRDGFALLAMGFTGARAMRWKLDFIDAFNTMEAEVRARPAAAVTPAGMLAALQDPATVLALIAHHAQETLAARAETIEAKAETTVTRQALVVANYRVAEQRPTVEAYRRLADAEGTYCITDAAKAVGVRPAELFAYLCSNRWIYERGIPRRGAKAREVAHQDRLDDRTLVHKTHVAIDEDGEDRVYTQVLVTAKGVAKLAVLLQARLPGL